MAAAVCLNTPTGKDSTAISGPHADDRLHFGTASMYRAAGFAEVARRNMAFPIMRLKVR